MTYHERARRFLIIIESLIHRDGVYKPNIEEYDDDFRYLENNLHLPVNREKSQARQVKDVEFLGFQILRGKIRIGNKSRIKFKKKVRRLTKRNNPLSMYQIIQDLNKYIRGWIGYYRIQEFRKILWETLTAGYVAA